MATEGRLVGRESSLADLASVRSLAGSGALSVRLIEGEAGVGKTALVTAAADRARADGWSTVWLSGVQSESTMAFAGLLGLVTPLHEYLPEVSDRLRGILAAALGWSTASEGSDRFLVGAAVIELLAAAAQAQPLFLVVGRRPVAGPGVGRSVAVRGPPAAARSRGPRPDSAERHRRPGPRRRPRSGDPARPQRGPGRNCCWVGGSIGG